MVCKKFMNKMSQSLVKLFCGHCSCDCTVLTNIDVLDFKVLTDLNRNNIKIRYLETGFKSQAFFATATNYMMKE